MLSPWQKLAIAFVVLTTLYAVLVSERMVLDAANAELQAIEDRFGRDARDRLVARATRWYTAVIIDSGFQQEVWEGYTRTPEQRAKTPEFETGPFAAGIDWFEGRIRVFFTLIFQVFLRFSAIVLWAPYVVVMAAYAIAKAIKIRRIKQTNFDYVSPLGHRYSYFLVRVLMVGTVLLFVLPFQLPAEFIPIIGALTALSLGFVLANTQKRI